MIKSFKLVFVYPNGRVEEIDEFFNTLEKAKEYGEGLLVQVMNTEQFHAGRKDASTAYFMIIEVGDEGNRIVYNSKGE